MPQTNQNTKEIGRIELREGQDLVVSLVDDGRVDIRVFLDSESYKGPTKRGVRFYLFDGIWEKFYQLMGKVNEEYEKLKLI